MVGTYEITGEWFASLEELEEYITEQGYEVLDGNREYITFEDKDENQYAAYLGGTERTIYIERIEEA